MDVVKNIQGIKTFGCLFHVKEDLTEQKILKMRIPKNLQ